METQGKERNRYKNRKCELLINNKYTERQKLKSSGSSRQIQHTHNSLYQSLSCPAVMVMSKGAQRAQCRGQLLTERGRRQKVKTAKLGLENN